VGCFRKEPACRAEGVSSCDSGDYRLTSFGGDPFVGSMQSLNYHYVVLVYFPDPPSESKLSSEFVKINNPAVGGVI
jgi:hypothetical protein